MVSLTRVYPGTIQFHLAINVYTQTQSGQLSMSTRTQTHNLSMPNNGRDQLSMSTRTQACNFQSRKL